MHEILWQKLEALDGVETAKKAACTYDAKRRQFAIKMLDTEYLADCKSKRISGRKNGKTDEAGYLEQLCILSYLINATETRPSGRLAKAESLPAGQFFFRGLHGLPTDKLAGAFSDNPRKLLNASEKLEAAPRDYGDTSVEIRILPKLPVTLVVWRADEEFGPRASILFDETAAEHMPLDALLAAVNLAVDAVTAGRGR
jgi:hypothetical protein